MTSIFTQFIFRSLFRSGAPPFSPMLLVSGGRVGQIGSIVLLSLSQSLCKAERVDRSGDSQLSLFFERWEEPARRPRALVPLPAQLALVLPTCFEGGEREA